MVLGLALQVGHLLHHIARGCSTRRRRGGSGGRASRCVRPRGWQPAALLHQPGVPRRSGPAPAGGARARRSHGTFTAEPQPPSRRPSMRSRPRTGVVAVGARVEHVQQVLPQLILGEAVQVHSGASAPRAALHASKGNRKLSQAVGSAIKAPKARVNWHEQARVGCSAPVRPPPVPSPAPRAPRSRRRPRRCRA